MREHTDGDFPFANDFNAIAQALADQAAVDNGCTVSDGGTNDMTVDAAAGDARINGNTVTVGSQSTTLAAADGSNDRYDLVVVGSDGTIDNVTGTASSQPAAPSIPADHVLLAIVHVQAGVTGVTDGDIFDARAVIQGVLRQEYTPPSGLITMWSGSISNIPSGWVLCDGNNGTPNLQDRFVVGAGSTYAVGATGGESTHTLTESELASHAHSAGMTASDGTLDKPQDGSSSSGSFTTNSAGGDSAHENKPPYYALAFIMHT